MKTSVCYITPEYPPFTGGIATVSEAFVNLLAENKFFVTLITVNAAEKITRGNVNHVDIRSGNTPLEKFLFKFADRIKITGLLTWLVIITKTLFAFIALHRKNKFSVVVNHDYYASAILVNLLKKALKKISGFTFITRISAPLNILSSQYFLIPTLEKKFMGKAEFMNIKHADYVSYASERMLELIEKKTGKFKGKKIKLIPPLPRIKLINKRKSNVCIYTGRIQDGKGVEDLIHAWSLLKQEIRKNTVLKLIGSDMSFRNGSSLKAHLVDEYLHNDPAAFNVEFQGSLDRDEVAAELAAAKFLIAPSRLENYPNTVAEAMQYGLFIVGTEKTGVADIINDYQYKPAVLFPAGNYQQLAKVLSDILKKEVLPKAELNDLRTRSQEFNRKTVEFLRKLSR